jgi:hypothetical protein
MTVQGANYPLQAEQDCDFVSPVFIVFNPTTQLPVNLTGYSAALKIRTSQFGSGSNPGTVLLSLTSAPGAGIIITPLSGQIVISITKAQLVFSPGTWWWDLLLTSPSSQTVKELAGPFILGSTITQ